MEQSYFSEAKSHPPTETEVLLQFSQQPAIGPYPEPDESSPHPLIPFL
jgi:hypothetical protein